MIPLKPKGYKANDLLNRRFTECKTCGESIVTGNLPDNPFKFLYLDPKLNDDMEYNLHVCPRNHNHNR